MSRALQLKEEGNQHFRAGDYSGADSLYSKAIIDEPRNPALFTNRAMARLKLGYWDSVISDCRDCLLLSPKNMKAYFYLGQAQLAIRDFDGALENSLKAHELCVQSNDKSLASVTTVVLRCKKERWDDMERRRVRESQALERSMLELLDRERDEMLKGISNELERKTVEEEAETQKARLQEIFERARTDAEKKRDVPDWAIDDISFGIMVDPVVTRGGKSYERASIAEYLNRHSNDPLTREPMTVKDLRPNLALKEACSDFLEKNGWAADW